MGRASHIPAGDRLGLGGHERHAFVGGALRCAGAGDERGGAVVGKAAEGGALGERLPDDAVAAARDVTTRPPARRAKEPRLRVDHALG